MNKNYHDKYFEHHHWLLKIWQTLIMLLSWLVLFIPIFITTATYLAYRTNGRHGHFFWHYQEGFQELNFLMIFLLFALGMISVFCLTMGYIQTQRMSGLTTKWPMFNISQSNLEQKRAERFMTKRFGPRQQRINTRYRVIKPDQNLSKNQLRDIINGKLEEKQDGF